MLIFWTDVHTLFMDKSFFLTMFPDAADLSKDYVCFEDMILHLIGHALFSYGKSLYTYSEQPKLQHNISHSGSIAVCAFDTAPIGIDIEQILPYPVDVSPFFHTAEQAYLSQFSIKDRNREFYRLWTRKESLYKAQRLHDMNLLQLECMVNSSGKLREYFYDWSFEELPIQPEKYLTVVCRKKADPLVMHKISVDDLLEFIRNPKRPFRE